MESFPDTYRDDRQPRNTNKNKDQQQVPDNRAREQFESEQLDRRNIHTIP